MTQAPGAQDARHQYIDVLRSMNPDAEMNKRLDALERRIKDSPTVTVTRADLEDFIRPFMAYADSSAVDKVVDEIDGRLGLVGEHPVTTALRSDTVQKWIKLHVDEDIGHAELTSIIEGAIT
jgi:hypothetical protein